ncbi:MAG: CoA ester lyase [Spongiibacteraceae bacterium]|nr:CoA ester lyase [Spongiibacteraceae bacterium]
MSHRPRRSVLYMPASNQRAMDKARTLAADTLVFDLEDAVGPEKKQLAREQSIAALQAAGYGKRELVVRINGQGTSWWADDIDALAQSGLDAICLPKVESVDEVDALVSRLEKAGAPDSIVIWVMIETPLGVLKSVSIANHPRVGVIVMGTTDLAKELRVPHVLDRIGLLTSLGQCVLAARACEVEILDGVYLDLDDADGFAFSCKQGRHLGFDGKTLIHPRQIAMANQCFGPSVEELLHAEKIIAAWSHAQAQGKGVVLVDGKLVEGMHIDEAKRNLSIAQHIKAMETKD